MMLPYYNNNTTLTDSNFNIDLIGNPLLTFYRISYIMAVTMNYKDTNSLLNDKN
jgi:hypothetical protein